MSETSTNFDATWDDIYQRGQRHQNRYPFDTVVQFVFSQCPKDIPRSDVEILEVGCGAGNNLWFAAREGFRVTGIDASKPAVNLAIERFDEDGLQGDIRIGDANHLPFDGESFDLVIDRAALSHTQKNTIARSIGEIHRVLKPGGKFHFNPFGDCCSSAQRHAHDAADTGGALTNITDGFLKDAGLACVYSRTDIEALFEQGWNLLSLKRIEYTYMNAPLFMIHEEWVAIAEKVADPL